MPAMTYHSPIVSGQATVPTPFQSPPIFLAIIDFVDIPTLLNLRLLSRFTYVLISEHESSISKKLARNAWHTTTWNYDAPYLSVSSLGDLIRVNIAHQLAIKATASNQLYFWDVNACAGIRPDDAKGDELRDSVTRGFMLLYHLPRLQIAAKHTSSNRPRSLVDRTKSLVAGAPTIAQKSEESAVLHQWSEYTSSLAASDLVDFQLMTDCVRGKVIYDNSFFSTELPDIPVWAHLKAKETITKLDWIVGYLLRQGPVFVQKLWSENKGIASAQSGCLRTVILHRSAKIVSMESATAWWLIQGRKETHTEARAYYTSTYYFRRGSLPMDMPREQQLAIRSFGLESWLHMQTTCTLGTSLSSGVMRTGKRGERRAPSLYKVRQYLT